MICKILSQSTLHMHVCVCVYTHTYICTHIHVLERTPRLGFAQSLHKKMVTSNLKRSQEQRWDYTSRDTALLDQREQRKDEIKKGIRSFGILQNRTIELSN